MSMLLTTSLILGTFAAPVPEAQFESQFRSAMADLAAPLVVLEEETTDGQISAFDEESKSVTIVDADGGTHAFSWDDSTQWMLNGEKATRQEVLVSGRDAQVKHNAEGLAAKVSVTTK